MAYCTYADLETYRLNADKLAELSAHDPDGTVNTARITAACEDVSYRIDCYIRGRATLPVTDADTLAFLRGIALDLAVCALFTRYSVPSEETTKECDRAVDMLEAIRDGKMLLPSGGAIAAPPGVWAKSNLRTLTIGGDTSDSESEGNLDYFP